MKIHAIYTIFIIGLILSTIAIPGLIDLSNGQTEEQLRIVLKQPLKSIGADGGEYPIYIEIQNMKGEPVELNRDINIQLFSSDTRVGEVPTTVTLKSGSFYTIAYFKSTNTPGTTIITAMAPGFQSGTLSVKTDYSVGYPKRIVVYIYPDELLPNPAEEANVVVELQDTLGKPARAPDNIRVNLYSSNILVGDVVSNTVTIKKGSTYAVTKFRPTNIPGTTIITASATGYESGKASVSTVGPTPKKLVVTAAPTKLPSNGVDKSFVFITAYLVDDEGYPARADRYITVTFTSSDTSLGYFKTTQLTINPGEFYLQNRLYSNTKNGTGVIEVTVQAEDLEPSKTYVTVLPPSNYTKGVLKVYGAPSTFPPGEEIYPDSIVVQIESFDGVPIIASNPVKIYLSSSETLYGNVVQSSININASSSIGVADFQTTNLVGDTKVTASADDFQSGHVIMGVYAPPPVKLKLGVGPTKIRATGESYPFLYVQLQDEYGRPAAAQDDILVDLSSSNENSGIVPSNVLIQQGESFEFINFTSTNFPGDTNITASAEGYESDIILISTIEPFPSILSSKIYTTYIAGGKTYPLYIQLLDSLGRPARPEIPVQIFLRSSNTNIVNVTDTVILQEGASYAVVDMTTSDTPGSATISIAAPGYSPDTLTFESTTLTLDLNMSAYKTSIYSNETLEFTVYVSSSGVPLKDVDLIISADKGLVPSSGKTDENGLFTFTYTPLRPGNDTVKVMAMKAGYIDNYQEYNIYVDKYITLKVKLQTKDGLGIEGLNITIKDGSGNEKSAISGAGGYAYFKNIKWGNISVTVIEESTTTDTKYIFMEWEDGGTENVWNGYLENDKEIIAIYKIQYYVDVRSEYGNPYGSGWYDKGTSISIGIDETKIPINWILSKKFDSWTGDVYSTEPQAPVLVDSPKRIQAVWVDDYTNLYYLIAIIAAIVVVVILIILYYKGIIFKGRRKPEEEEEAEEWIPEEELEEEISKEEEKVEEEVEKEKVEEEEGGAEEEETGESPE